MKSYAALALVLEGAYAFPTLRGLEGLMGGPLAERAVSNGCTVSAACNRAAQMISSFTDAQIGYDASNPTPAQQVSAARTNCGIQGPCGVFDAALQLVSVSGSHAYVNPKAGEIRGPCPGLNAAANHGYLPRSGVATIADTVLGLGQNYGMDAELAAFLAAYAIAIDGDVLTGTWSIGGPQQTLIPPGLIHSPQGISYSHNKYEGDSSIGRCDAYMNHGDAHSLSIPRWVTAWQSCTNDRCTLDKFSRDFTKKSLASVATNPYYFAPLFSTTLVAPAAYNFVINFMSNHSAAEPNGYLDRKTFATFFGVGGTSPKNFYWKKGKERIPENWYRRPMLGPTTEYTAVGGVIGDLAAEFAAYPLAFRFGGNTGKKNSFVGIDLGQFTNGGFSSSTTPGNQQQLSCFFYQFAQQFFPDEIQAGPNGGTGPAAVASKLLFGALDAAFSTVAGCPAVTKFNDNLFGKYPGRNYNPKGTAGTTC